MNGGNILVLQQILGHTNIKQTMAYSHFAPSHLNDAILLNPLEMKKKMAANKLNRHLIATRKHTKHKPLILNLIKHRLFVGKILPIL